MNRPEADAGAGSTAASIASWLVNRGICVVMCAGCMVSAACTASAAPASDQHWVATWSASPMAADSAEGDSNGGFYFQTVREVAHVSIGGHKVRVRLSNAFGARALRIGAAHVALHGVAASIVAGSDRTLTFQGSGAVTIPSGALVLSDPVDLDVPALADLAVSIYLPGVSGPLTWHQLGMQKTYVSEPGDATAAATMPVAVTTNALYLLAGIEVLAPRQVGAVVALGDSITDGYGSTPDAQHRWPDYLSRRLNAESSQGETAVLNQGISGNRLLHDLSGPASLSRFDRDVLAQPGVTHLIVLEGINDIGEPASAGRPEEEVTAGEITAALAQLIERAHERGLRIYGATLTPFEGTEGPYYSAAGEAKRTAVNGWIRTQARFDAVIDFDQVIRDPAHPARMLPSFDSGDHLHPGDAGYQAMAESVDLALLRGAARR